MWLTDARAHAAQEHPREACGLVILHKGREVYHPCQNVAPEPERDFAIHPEDWANASQRGDVVRVVHSHPNGDALPSDHDRASCEATQLPWTILGGPREFISIDPSGWVAPLIGRQYSYGTHDCWALVRDYYARELGIQLPDFERQGRFWERGEDRLTQHTEAAGFRRVDDLQPGDVLLCGIRFSVPDHLAVYLGDETILHHPHGRLSGKEGYSVLWQQATRGIYRHESRCLPLSA